MAESIQPVELHVGPQGRLVIPARLRRVWHIEPGEVLLARLENDRLILEKPTQILQRVKERYAALRSQPSLADELIAERRAEAKREDAL
jgi:bifunctional DNA-binding transcriptional regulator/antitoxin component of YhaV-PrlF toxin-antitoxin module